MLWHCRKHIETMPWRMSSPIKAKGDTTKYQSGWLLFWTGSVFAQVLLFWCINYISAYWCTFVFVCVCDFVYVSLHVPSYLIVCLPWQQQSSWKDADKAKAMKRDRGRERERMIESQFRFNCDFLDEMNVCTHAHTHKHMFAKNKALK